MIPLLQVAPEADVGYRRSMPVEPPHESDSSTIENVEATRAATGIDLWPAIEAAQYARVILCVEPSSERERAAMSDFLKEFTHYVESWESLAPGDQAVVLGSLGRQLDALGREHLHIHWAVTERKLRAPEGGGDRVPLAVIVIGATDAETATVAVPTDLEVDTEDDEGDED